MFESVAESPALANGGDRAVIRDYVKIRAMNERKYYQDSYTTKFTAVVTEKIIHEGSPAVVLDQTYFYPTSGGQPHDLGQIGKIAITDVLVREEDGAIIHVMSGEIAGDRVTAEIDWPRRFDHMQHHTGQHILSQAFIRVAGAETVGFHLSEASVTIDLDKKDISEADILSAEQMTNDIIWQNLPVKILEVSLEEAARLPLRKIPPTPNGTLRLIDIGGFDLTACGGTHVGRTAEVGLLKIVKQERRGGKQRIEFRCGGRALNDYREKHNVANLLSGQLTTGIDQLVSAVDKLQEELKESRRQLKKLQGLQEDIEAEHLWKMGRRHGDLIIVTRVYSDRDQGEIRALAKRMAQHEHTVALLGCSGERSALIFHKAEGVLGSMKEILPLGLQELNSNSGGGNDGFAQGVGPAAGEEQVEKAIEAALNAFIRNLDPMR